MIEGFILGFGLVLAFAVPVAVVVRLKLRRSRSPALATPGPVAAPRALPVTTAALASNQKLLADMKAKVDALQQRHQARLVILKAQRALFADMRAGAITRAEYLEARDALDVLANNGQAPSSLPAGIPAGTEHANKGL